MRAYGTPMWESIKWPGLTPSAGRIEELAAQIPVKLAVLSYKSSRCFLWVVLVGGTGTGKSTLFNALIGKPVSETGVERPKTNGPLAYAHRSTPVERDFPFSTGGVQRVEIDAAGSGAYSGTSGQLLLLDHGREEHSHLVIVDTPDLDSLELGNRRMVEDLLLLADWVVFVASQEKYADDVPFRFLSRVHKGKTPYFLVLNKADDALTPDAVLEVLRDQGLSIAGDRFWILPHVSGDPFRTIGRIRGFTEFKSTLLGQLDKSRVPDLCREGRMRAAGEIKAEILELLDLLRKEEDEAFRWSKQLDVLYESACTGLLSEQEERFTGESRTRIQREIGKHFSKYDLLRTPRRFVSQIIRTPLRALGLWPAATAAPPHNELDEVFRRAEFGTILASVEGFNRSVLEKLSPLEKSSALYGKLREPGLALTPEEIRLQVTAQQERLRCWLEETFQRLAQGIPRSKEWGIYSVSILWGGLILALETAIGGGLSLLEAVLDTAVAPFVTKGAVDLFAYRELQKIARDLGKLYREALTAALQTQHQRYGECLQSLRVAPGMLRDLTALMSRIKSEGEFHPLL